MRVVTDPAQHELWKSAIPGTIYVKRFDRAGELVDEMVGPGKSIHLTPNERRLNQEMAAEPELDVFMNGFMVPVRILAVDTEESVAFEGNPNHLSDDDMKSLLQDKTAVQTLDKTLAGISNPITLQRMLAVADEIDASIKQAAAIKVRMSELGDGSTFIETETVAGPDGRPVVQTAAPGVEAPKKASAGRRVARPPVDKG